MDQDQAYFERRAVEERAAAAQAVHPKARAAHELMAERYERRLAELAAEQPGPTLHLVA